MVAGKTGSLIATSARYGARFSGAPRDVEEALTEYGEKVGVAFQLSDDILDIASETDVSGKTPGTDLREGVPTLPVLIARRSTDPGDARLLELLDADLTDDALHAETLALLRAHPAMGEARAYVVNLAGEAKALLKVLPEGAGAHRPGGLRRRGRHPLELRLSSGRARSESIGSRSLAGTIRVPAQVKGTMAMSDKHATATGGGYGAATTGRRVRLRATSVPPGGYYGGPPGTPPPNHLVWAILSTLFCCLPLGIASIVFAAQVNGKYTAGDFAGPQESSRKARTFALWGTIIGLVLAVLYLLLVVVLGVGLQQTAPAATDNCRCRSPHASRPPGPPGGARRCRCGGDRGGRARWPARPCSRWTRTRPATTRPAPSSRRPVSTAPGCGALRAMHDLLHGDLAGALARNPLTVLAVPYLVLAFVTWLLRRSGRPAPRSTSLPPWTIWLLLAVVVAFGVLRNLPGWAWLSPA